MGSCVLQRRCKHKRFLMHPGERTSISMHYTAPGAHSLSPGTVPGWNEVVGRRSLWRVGDVCVCVSVMWTWHARLQLFCHTWLAVGCHARFFFNKHGGRKNYLAGRTNPTSSSVMQPPMWAAQSLVRITVWGQVSVSGLVYFTAQ